jgi:hypothetical protein
LRASADRDPDDSTHSGDSADDASSVDDSGDSAHDSADSADPVAGSTNGITDDSGDEMDVMKGGGTVGSTGDITDDGTDDSGDESGDDMDVSEGGGAVDGEEVEGGSVPTRVAAGTRAAVMNARKKAVRNLFRRMRGARALTEQEMADMRTRRDAERVAKSEASAAAKEAKRLARASSQVASKRRARQIPGASMMKRMRSKFAQRRSQRQRQRRNVEDPYEALRGDFDKEKLRRFFRRRPGQIAARLAAVLRVGNRLIRLWRREESLPPEQRTRAEQLRVALSGLGPVFVKIGQTLSQRADLIGDEAADALKALQQSNAPFPDGLAYRYIAEDLVHAGPLAPSHPSCETCEDASARPLFAAFSDGPIAAASLGQVYMAPLTLNPRP